jgi:chemosensory pili system protein ChpA (sensor histidine kinase/response regulator)
MGSFSIDDVRESFTADMTALLGQVDAAAQAARALPGLALTAGDAGLVERLGDGFHAMGGTTSLVAAHGLARAAHLCERLAGAARDELVEIARRSERARRLVELCARGAVAMRAMLPLELAGEGAAAVQLAEELERDAEADRPEPPAPPAPAAFPVEEWSFLEEPGAAAPAAASPELAEIFRVEATRELSGLGALLEEAAARPDDPRVAEAIERVFHTIKGAAATVGLGDVARLAADTQHALEQVVDAGTAIGADLLATATQAAWTIARAARLEAVGLPAPPSVDPAASFSFADVPPPAPPEPRPAPVRSEAARLQLRQVFVVEVRQTLVAAGPLQARLGAAPERAAATRAELAELFHRIKGSALLVDEHEVAAQAARLQEACEGGGQDLDGALAQGVAAIARLTGVDLRADGRRRARAALPALVREPVKAVEASLLEAFTQECAELMDTIERLIVQLDAAPEPRQVITALLRPYHTLKGAVNSVGMLAVGRELHVLEDYLEGLSDADVLPPPRTLAAFLIDVQSGLRRNLTLAKSGYVEASVARLEAKIAALSEPIVYTESGSELERSLLPSVESPSMLTGPDVVASGSSREVFEGGDSERRTLRVAAERLDALMNLAGELVVSRSRLLARVDAVRANYRDLLRSRRRLVDTVEQFRERHEFTLAVRAPKEVETQGFTELELDRYDDVNVLARSLAEISNDVAEMDSQLVTDLVAFSEDSEALGTLVSGIQTEVTSARMVPLEQLFTRLRLAVRDAADREHKEVRIVSEGEAVRLDKTIIDALFTPMLHLVRNAVGHGVEAPSARAAVGKPTEGTVSLIGRQESGQIVIEVRDDGGGLDLARLHQRGVAAGLLPATTALTDPAVPQLVFAPGVSTRDVAEDVAGRGIGGDVVKRAIERMNGDVRVDSRAGAGTVFTIVLPVTLAITRAVVVRHRDQAYAVPLYFAERVLAAEETQVLDSAGVRRVRVGDEFVKLERLEECFGAAREGDGGPVVLLRVGDESCGLQVDAVLGQEEIVVKRLGDLLGGHPLFSGMTVRGAGELVLILDVPGLLRQLGARVPGQAPTPRPTVVFPAPAPAAPAPAAPVRARALWADDSLSVRKVAEKELGALDVEAVVAVDGLDALAKLREGHFDIAFIDLEMPGMNGYELMRAIRAGGAHRELPMVVVSSRSSAKHQTLARECGANAFVTKPFTGDMLVRLLDEWVPAWRGGKS